MFVRGRMEDDVRPMLLHHLLEAIDKAHIDDDRRQHGRWSQPLSELQQFAVDLKDAVLAVAQQDQPGRLKAQNLPAQLTADGTARPGDQHTAAADQFLDGRRVRPHRLAAQEVFDLNGAQLVDADRAAQQFVDAWHGARRRVGLLANLDHVANHLA